MYGIDGRYNQRELTYGIACSGSKELKQADKENIVLTMCKKFKMPKSYDSTKAKISVSLKTLDSKKRKEKMNNAIDKITQDEIGKYKYNEII